MGVAAISLVAGWTSTIRCSRQDSIRAMSKTAGRGSLMDSGGPPGAPGLGDGVQEVREFDSPRLHPPEQEFSGRWASQETQSTGLLWLTGPSAWSLTGSRPGYGDDTVGRSRSSLEYLSWCASLIDRAPRAPTGPSKPTRT